MLPADVDVIGEVKAFLAGCRTASLASLAADGAPHAANVQFAFDDHLRLYWFSSPRSAHSQHLNRDGRAAVTIYGHDETPAVIHGLQAHGVVDAVDDPARHDHAWRLYAGRFPFVVDQPGFQTLIERQTLYCFAPTWLRWIDNRRGFGFKVERERRGGAWVAAEPG